MHQITKFIYLLHFHFFFFLIRLEKKATNVEKMEGIMFVCPNVPQMHQHIDSRENFAAERH